MAVKQQVFKSAERNEGKPEPFISWQTDFQLLVATWSSVNCTLITVRHRTNGDLLLLNRERQSSSISFSLNFCPCASHHLSLQLYLYFCASSILFLSQGGSCEMNVTPLTMLLRGNWLFSLCAVDSHMLIFHIPETWEEGAITSVKVRITALLPVAGGRRGPFCHTQTQLKLPSLLQSALGPGGVTLMLTFYSNLFTFLHWLQPSIMASFASHTSEPDRSSSGSTDILFIFHTFIISWWFIKQFTAPVWKSTENKLLCLCRLVLIFCILMTSDHLSPVIQPHHFIGTEISTQV